MKMRFENFIYKKKKEISFSPLPSSVSACRPFLPRPAHSPLPLPRSARQPPAQPRAPAARPSSRASPTAAPAQQATPGNRPRPRAQTLTARARLSAPSSPRAPRNRPARPHAATAPTPRRGSVPPSRPAALNRHRAVSAPPCCPPLSLSRLPCTEEARSRRPEVSELRRPPLHANTLLRAASVSISPLVSFAVLPSISRYLFFSFLLASRALAASSAGHGRWPWRPPR